MAAETESFRVGSERVGKVRIGVDLGGSKIEAVALDVGGRVVQKLRAKTPNDYPSALQLIAALVLQIEQQLGQSGTVGVGMPGAVASGTGLVTNANCAWLNGQPLAKDLSSRLARRVRCANDANCFAMSEATDGAGAGYEVVFAVILGTGCGAGIVCRGRILSGRSGLAGEWGHNSLPWPLADEYPGLPCYCGKLGCLETWVSGPGLAADYRRSGGEPLTAPEIIRAAETGEMMAVGSLTRYEDRLARGLATLINVLDPDVVVLGGGMSNLASLYRHLPLLLPRYTTVGRSPTPVLPALHGDASGVRGAAWLWGPDTNGCGCLAANR